MAPKKKNVIVEENINDNLDIKEPKSKSKIDKQKLETTKTNNSGSDSELDSKLESKPKAKAKAKSKAKAKPKNEDDNELNILNSSTEDKPILKSKVKKKVDQNVDENQIDNIKDEIKPKSKTKTKPKIDSDTDSIKEIKSKKIFVENIVKVTNNDSDVSDDDIKLDDNNQYIINIINNNITYKDIDQILNSNDITKKEELVDQIRNIHIQRLEQKEIVKKIINKIDKYDEKDIKQLQYILDKNNKNDTNCLTSKIVTTTNKHIINHDTETNSDMDSVKSDSDIKPLIINKKKKVININESDDSDNSE